MMDWFKLNAGHLDLMQTWTRKFTDPRWRGSDGAKLKLTLTLPQTNRIVFAIIENEWRSYRGPGRTFTCVREFRGDEAPQSVVLALGDFAGSVGQQGALETWSGVDQFGEHGGAGRGSHWNGAAPKFHRLEWI